jgi:phosphomannomutase
MSTQQLPIIAKLAVYKIDPGVYEFNVSNGTDTLYEDTGFVSIETALMAAGEQDGPICGFEVSYGSIVVGTYLCEELKTQAAQIAEHAVARQAVFTER